MSDRPRDWRDAHLASPHPGKRKSPAHRERDYRGYPRSRGDRGDGYRDSRRYDENSPRGRPSDGRRDLLDYGDPKSDEERARSNAHTPRGTSPPRQDTNDDMEEGEISSPPPPPRVRRPQHPEDKAEAPTPPEPLPEMELSIPASPPPIEDIIAARRARQAAILAKYNSQKVQPPDTASVGGSTPQLNTFTNGTAVVPAVNADSGVNSVGSDADTQDTPGTFDLAKDAADKALVVAPSINASELSNVADLSESTIALPIVFNVDGIDEQVSAADYDPSMDRREEDARHALLLADGVREIPNQPEISAIDSGKEIGDEGEEEDDIDDMFAIDVGKPKGAKAKKSEKPILHAPPQPMALTNADIAADPEGYYQIVLGEALDGGRYQVFSSLGRGMFSAVVRARIIQGEGLGKEVAVKIIRAQESMFKAGLKEIQTLNKLMQADPEDKKHVIRLERTFEHRGHLCLVFESLSMNLREVVKRFGKDVGLNIAAVRAYTYQLFLSLSLLQRCNIMHADIKPDNILVNEAKNQLKLCDLGSASDVSENEIAPYLVSRFYRAPEIILGLPYDAALDVWSVGCTLYELYTGKILFPGRSNNQMLLHMMELRGRFNSKMIKRAKFGDIHFDDSGLFISVELDKMGKNVVKLISITKPKRDLRARIIPSGNKYKDDELKLLTAFVDLLDKCLTLDPTKRITPKEALNHPFVRG